MNNGVDDRQYGTIRMKLAASDIGIYGLGMTHVSAKLHAPNHDLSIRLCVRCKPKPCIVATQRDLNVAENAAHDALLTFSLRLRTLSGHYIHGSSTRGKYWHSSVGRTACFGFFFA